MWQIKNKAPLLIESALDIRINRFGLTPRQSIWKGGVEPDTLPMLDEQGKQVEIDGVKETITNPKAGEDWCFAFGEWMSGKSWDAVYKSALGKVATATQPAVSPVGRISCE